MVVLIFGDEMTFQAKLTGEDGYKTPLFNKN